MSDDIKKRFFKLPEVAAHLNESEGTIRDWCARRIIPFYKRGRGLRFKVQEIEEWDRRRNRRPTLEERYPEVSKEKPGGG